MPSSYKKTKRGPSKTKRGPSKTKRRPRKHNTRSAHKHMTGGATNNIVLVFDFDKTLHNGHTKGRFMDEVVFHINKSDKTSLGEKLHELKNDGYEIYMNTRAYEDLVIDKLNSESIDELGNKLFTSENVYGANDQSKLLKDKYGKPYNGKFTLSKGETDNEALKEKIDEYVKYFNKHKKDGIPNDIKPTTLRWAAIKYYYLRQIRKKHPGKQIYFFDDTPVNVDMANIMAQHDDLPITAFQQGVSDIDECTLNLKTNYELETINAINADDTYKLLNKLVKYINECNTVETQPHVPRRRRLGASRPMRSAASRPMGSAASQKRNTKTTKKLANNAVKDPVKNIKLLIDKRNKLLGMPQDKKIQRTINELDKLIEIKFNELNDNQKREIEQYKTDQILKPKSSNNSSSSASQEPTVNFEPTHNELSRFRTTNKSTKKSSSADSRRKLATKKRGIFHKLKNMMRRRTQKAKISETSA